MTRYQLDGLREVAVCQWDARGGERTDRGGHAGHDFAGDSGFGQHFGFLAAAAVAAPKGPAAAFATALAKVELDGSKGVAMSFRAWDGQLRQPLLLGDGQAVIASAPAEGILHPTNALDALGADAPGKLCKSR